MTGPAQVCTCGRPMPAGGNLCRTCGEELRANLRRIADRWPELEACLTSHGAGGAKGRTKHGLVAVGTNVNEAALAARRACTDVVWFTLQVVRDDLDTAGRTFTPPATSSNRSQDDTPAVARWIADQHVHHVTHTTARETAVAISRDVERAEHLTYLVTETTPERRFDTQMSCEGGDETPCPGVMRATITDAMPDLVCSVDESHRIPPDVWSRTGWKRAHIRDEAAARRLAERIMG